MAEVVIKGMTLPKTCGKCPLKVEANWGLYTCPFQPEYVFALVSTFRSDKCPLIEVPEPHGRLVDADEMFVEFAIEGQRSKRYKLGEKWELNGEEIRSVISRLPTIIPASKEE